MIKLFLLIRVFYWEVQEFKRYCDFRLNGGWTPGTKPEGPLYELFNYAQSKTHCAFEDLKYGKPLYLYAGTDDRIYRRDPSLRPKDYGKNKRRA